MSRYWVGVACREHVNIGVEGGFCQLNHGKPTGLNRMKPGDWIVFYSPKETFPKGESCQHFTAYGQIANRDTYQVLMPHGEWFSRRDVHWAPSKPVSILPLLDGLDFVEDRRYWGAKFRYGHFQIGERDFKKITDI